MIRCLIILGGWYKWFSTSNGRLVVRRMWILNLIVVFYNWDIFVIVRVIMCLLVYSPLRPYSYLMIVLKRPCLVAHVSTLIQTRLSPDHSLLLSCHPWKFYFWIWHHALVEISCSLTHTSAIKLYRHVMSIPMSRYRLAPFTWLTRSSFSSAASRHRLTITIDVNNYVVIYSFTHLLRSEWMWQSDLILWIHGLSWLGWLDHGSVRWHKLLVFFFIAFVQTPRAFISDSFIIASGVLLNLSVLIALQHHLLLLVVCI